MRTIQEILKEKEEKLAQKMQEIKLLESQVAKLRGAIEIMREEEQGENEVLQFDSPGGNGRTSAASVAPPVRNWP